jgi:SAM-dependent methyltransferase
VSPRPTLPRYFLEIGLTRLLAKVPEGGVCLNLGCGTVGRYAEAFGRFRFVVGVDIAPQKLRGLPPWAALQASAAALPLNDETFDAIVAIESFEHIERNQVAMAEAFRTAKHGAFLIVTTPTSWTWPFELGRHGPHYYSRRELVKLIEAAGFTVSQFAGAGGVVFYLATWLKSWLSPVGARLFRQGWWRLIDGALAPLYALAVPIDTALCWPPSNWIVLAQKK